MINYYKDVSIILISYKSKKKIKNFLKSLSKENKIIILENSKDKINIDEIGNKNVEIFYVDNKGYAGSINFARNKIKTKYFFIFNPDVEEIDDSKIEYFYQKAQELNDSFSCLGPRYKNISSRTLKQSNENKEIGELPSISGAAMFFNSSNFDLVGGFDENFFLYFEETDYCKRAKKKGLISFQLNKIKITHKSGTSVEYDDEDEKKRIKNLCIWHFIWSKFYFYKKHYGYLFSIIRFIPILFSIIFKKKYYKLIRNNHKYEKYDLRYQGLMSSMKQESSKKRI